MAMTNTIPEITHRNNSEEYNLKKKNKLKATNSAEVDRLFEFMGAPPYDDILETLREISENDPNSIDSLMECNEGIMEVIEDASILTLLQPPEKIFLPIQDTTFLDISIPEDFNFEHVDFSFLLEEAKPLI